MNTDYIKIGDLANAVSVSRDTLRYYEKQGLLTPSLRNSSGYRLYTKDDIQRIGFVLAAKEVGFTLKEIQQLLNIEVTRDKQSCEDVKSFVDYKIYDVKNKIRELNRIKRSLITLSDACCGGSEPATHCTILATLSDVNLMKHRIRDKEVANGSD